MKKEHSYNIFNENLVLVKENKLVTTSLIVAKVFNKRHADVLKAIENLNCSKEFIQRNFSLSSYLDSTGRSLPVYEITRDGLMLLIMGFTGKEAMTRKEKFIEVFNKMESKLRELQNDDRNTIEWKNQRAELKYVRLGLCKAIKEFTEYADKQGSKHADYYYSHITIACNNALHNVNSLKKINKNLRDELDRKQVIKMQSLEIVLEDKLVALLKQGLLNYKEIFQKLKEICIKYADVIGMQKPRYITDPEYKKCMNGKQLKIFNVQQKQLELFEDRKMIS